jgi:hypothetical protein
LAEIMELEHADRQQWVKQVADINRRQNETASRR